MSPIAIVALSSPPRHNDHLARLLIEVVADGGSVGFLHPLAYDSAQRFWHDALAAADRGARIVLAAFEGETLVGTLSLLLDCPPNQPHRAELAKMMTRPSHRGRGIAAALVGEAERLAAQHRRSLLVLDTASEQGAAGFYEKLGYTRAGEIPDYAFKPHGGLTGTVLLWKRIEPVTQTA
ncbi:GNAT family N-acetyltransferase [Lysobacter capsici]|uniref:GNAT family N-acetyltransferase n=1 Tax=Lysobacter capsici TaxID=435897 RepID=UPI00287B63F2|nr:GNAT family N-acetyltransferase [Lysobacter capsici]WND82643.1 GNAT family N-acetyltransferase [Lysobacter capsici]WND87840.1 GNAT family N-acetyltransferase [Lysobacter capsici]